MRSDLASVETILIAEDLLLLLLDDETGKAVKGQELAPALGGALLVELALGHDVEIEPKEGMFHSPKVRSGDGVAPDDPVLAAALATAQEKPRKPQALVEKLGKGAKETLAARLVERGVLEQREGKVLGPFPRTTWPTKDASHENELRQRLATVLGGGQLPDERTGALVALLSAVDYAHKAVEVPGMGRSKVKARAKEIGKGDWAAKAVKDSIQAAQAATTAAIVVVTSAGATGAGSS